MRILTIVSTALVVLSGAWQPVRAADDNYLRAIAEKVRSVHPEMFDAGTVVPDSIAEGQDAVIIAELDYVNADFEEQNNAMMERTITKRLNFMRQMVKILTPKGVEDLSQHEFGTGTKLKIDWLRIADFKDGFGAVIHKPDGRVVEVDLSEAVNITTGKNDNRKKAVKRKIDIPGLEPGDVLDVFFSRDEWLQEFDLDPVATKIPTRYPIMNMKVEYVLHPSLTADYHGYNGAPAMQRSTDSKGRTVLTADFTNVPVVTDRKFMNRDRQIPFYMLDVLNYNSPYRNYSQPRRGGVSDNLLGAFYINRLIRAVYGANPADADIARPITNLVKDYAKAHPAATEEELVTVAWAATHYLNRTRREKKMGPQMLSILFAHILNKKPIEADSVEIAMINPRNVPDINNISSEDMARFGVRVAGRLYMMTEPEYYVGCEIPALYQGETGIAYPYQGRREATLVQGAGFTAVPRGPNGINVNAEVRLADLDSIEVAGTLELKGAMKLLASGFNSEGDINTALENILEIPENKRYRPEQPYETPDETRERESDTRKALAEMLFSGEGYRVDSYEIAANGLNPAQPAYKVQFAGTAPSAVTRAGDELIVPIGKLAGNTPRLEGSDRERQTDIYLPAAYSDRKVLKLVPPEGYAVDQASLEALTTNFANQLGSVATQAMLQGDGSVMMVVYSKMLHAIVPAELWPMMLELLDAQAAVSDLSVLLVKG